MKYKNCINNYLIIIFLFNISNFNVLSQQKEVVPKDFDIIDGDIYFLTENNFGPQGKVLFETSLTIIRKNDEIIEYSINKEPYSIKPSNFYIKNDNIIFYNNFAFVNEILGVTGFVTNRVVYNHRTGETIYDLVDSINIKKRVTHNSAHYILKNNDFIKFTNDSWDRKKFIEVYKNNEYETSILIDSINNTTEFMDVILETNNNYIVLGRGYGKIKDTIATNYGYISKLSLNYDNFEKVYFDNFEHEYFESAFYYNDSIYLLSKNVATNILENSHLVTVYDQNLKKTNRIPLKLNSDVFILDLLVYNNYLILGGQKTINNINKYYVGFYDFNGDLIQEYIDGNESTFFEIYKIKSINNKIYAFGRSGYYSTFLIPLSIPSSINEISNFKFYEIKENKILLNLKIDNYFVFDYLGNEIQVNLENNSLDFSKLGIGFYLISIISNNQKYLIKYYKE